MSVEFIPPEWRLVSTTPLGLKPKEFLGPFEAELGPQKPWSLYGLVLELSVDSETPVVKLLEAQPTVLNIDKLARRRYLLSGSIEAFRRFYQEYKEQKVAKALLVFLREQWPEFFEDLWPKHGVLAPLGISFRALAPEEVLGLDLAIRLRHYYVLTSFTLPEVQALRLFLEHGVQPVWKTPAQGWGLCLSAPPAQEIEEVLKSYREFLAALPEDWASALAPRAVSCAGYLFAPLLTYMAIFTQTLALPEHPLREVVKGLCARFKEEFPEPFGLLPE